MRRRTPRIMLALVVIIVAGGSGSTMKAQGSVLCSNHLQWKNSPHVWPRSMAMPRSARNLRNPVPNAPEAIAAGRMHWADHCAVCHANDGRDTEMGSHMYRRAP